MLPTAQIVPIELAQWRRNGSPVYLITGELNGAPAFALGSAQGLVYLGLITAELSLEAQVAQWQAKYQSELLPQPPEHIQYSFADWLSSPWVLIGSEFQRRVWQALLNIPRGQVTSYKALAATVNSPKGYQAVGQAVGANPLSVLIPCHRVINQNGDLGGYHWGLALKKHLLISEGAMREIDGEKLVPSS